MPLSHEHRALVQILTQALVHAQLVNKGRSKPMYAARMAKAHGIAARRVHERRKARR